MAQSPSFNLSATGVGKETTFGVPVAPTIYVSARDLTMTGNNQFLERSAARNQIGMEEPEAGPFGATGAVTVESDPDIMGTLLAWAMGAESVAPNATSGNPAVNAQVSTTITAAVASGSATIPLAATTNVVAGSQLVLDPLGTAEPVTVASLAGNVATLTTPTVFPHNSGALVMASTAYDHTLILGSPRPSFTLQNQNQTDCNSYFGQKFSDFSIALDPKQLVSVAFRTVYASEGVTTPGTRAFSQLKPWRVLDAGNQLTVNGQPSPAGILSMNLSVALGLQPAEYTLGSGRFITSIPEGQSRVTGSMTVQHNSPYFRTLFWGYAGATGPGSDVASASFAFTVLSPSYVNGAVKYGLKLIMPKVKIISAVTTGQSGGVMRENISFMAAQSAPGANDDLTAIVTSAAPLAA